MTEKQHETFLSIYNNILVKETTMYSPPPNITKPPIKWVGGKTQIINTLMDEFPTEMNNYRELFLGGGSVLLALLSYVKNRNIKIHGHIYAYDINEALVNVYKNIQSNHNELYEKIHIIIASFNECGDGEINRSPKNLEESKIAKENYYYWTRNEYNKLLDKTTTDASAMFIFLNKTCFRGIYRVGPNGFNVPYGHYKNPEIINKSHLDEICELIQPVIFECCDFAVSLMATESDDYIYIDPPYVPESNTSFVGYTQNGFNEEHHKTLFKLMHELTDKNIKFMASNSDVAIVRNEFANKKYSISTILCKRKINSKTPDSKTNEVIIKNY
jgi:DNA adenine methylase